MKDERQAPSGDSLDLRLVPLAAALWVGALAGLALSLPVLATAWVAVVTIAAMAATRCGRSGRVVAALVVICLAAGMAAGLSRGTLVRDGPVADLAAEKARVHVDAMVAADPRVRGGPLGTDETYPGDGYVLVRLRVDEISGRGTTYAVRTPVFAVAGDAEWADLLPGQRIQASGRLSAADGGDVAAFLRADGEPSLLGEPGIVARATEPLRAGLRDAVRAVPGNHRGLIPGMVVGDESLIDDELREYMRITSLTHLTAVSGTHVGIVLLAVLGTAKFVGVRGYALPVVTMTALVGFVLLVRPDPSVLRAAVMGSIAVMGLLTAGRRRALPALAAAVCILVLADPWLARSVGFALSVSATAGILVLVPMWERSMSWLPRPLALAVAVPLAAQVACTPVLLAAFGQFSVAFVPANLLVTAAVAPAMILGLAATVASVVVPAAASVLAWLAGLPTWWIAAVARWLAGQPGAEFTWPDGLAGAAAGLVVAVAALVLVPLAVRRPVVFVVVAGVSILVLLRAVPTPGWPPPGWLVVGCDVGQGDGFVLASGSRSAVVIDTGPDPLLMRRCLDGLGITHVHLLVLTHYHADHVDGVPGVLAGRTVDRVLVSPLDEPVAQARRVERWLADADVPIDVARPGHRLAVGDAVTLEVVWPRRIIRAAGESDANNASVVLAVDAGGVQILFTGDIEPAAQRALLRAEPDLRAQVVKVSHHGSRFQDERMLTGLDAQLALISVGDNHHGHPSTEVLDALDQNGVEVRRTDEHGTFAVVDLDGGRLGTVLRRPLPRCRRHVACWFRHDGCQNPRSSRPGHPRRRSRDALG